MKHIDLYQKLLNLNSHPLEVVSVYRDSQFQVVEKCSYLLIIALYLSYV